MINAVYKSLVRAVVDLVEEIKNTGIHQDVQYWPWESRADENDLPKKTLIGVDAFNFEDHRGLWIIRFSIGISSYQDAYLHEEMEMIDLIFNRLKVGEKIIFRDPTTGAEMSELVSAAWEMTPMSQSELRNYRTISVELLRTAS